MSCPFAMPPPASVKHIVIGDLPVSDERSNKQPVLPWTCDWRDRLLSMILRRERNFNVWEPTTVSFHDMFHDMFHDVFEFVYWSGHRREQGTKIETSAPQYPRYVSRYVVQNSMEPTTICFEASPF